MQQGGDLVHIGFDAGDIGGRGKAAYFQFAIGKLNQLLFQDSDIQLTALPPGE